MPASAAAEAAAALSVLVDDSLTKSFRIPFKSTSALTEFGLSAMSSNHDRSSASRLLLFPTFDGCGVMRRAVESTTELFDVICELLKTTDGAVSAGMANGADGRAGAT